MTLHKLANFIPPVILDRARPYTKNGSITMLRELLDIRSTKYTASVAGRGGNYRVSVEIENENSEVIGHACNCPFDGDLCKHQAAVLLVIAKKETGSPDDELPVERVEKKKSKLAAAEDLLDKLSKEELVGFMKKAFEREPQLRKEFLATFSAKTASSKKDYKEIIAAALQGLKGARTFRDWSAISRTMDVVWNLLKQAEESITTDPARTLQITQAVVEKMVPALQYVDDSNGDLSGGIQQAVHLMYLASETNHGEPLRSEWFEWLVKSAQHKDYQGWDCSWDFATLAALVATPDEERKVVALATAMKQLHKEKDSWLADYTAEHASKVLLAFIEKNKSKEETEAFILQNVHHDGIRRMALKHYLGNKNFASAIKLCREGITLAVEKNLPGLVSQWYETLMEIYESQGDERSVKECATYLFYNSHADMKLYRVLKKTSTDAEWTREKSALLKHLARTSNVQLLATICVEEGDTVRLLEVLKATRHIHLLQEFGKYLPEQDKPTVQQLYFNLLTQDLERKANRNNYRDVARVLKKMVKTFDKRAIADFVREAKMKYRQRPALLEELSEVEVVVGL